MNAAWAGGVDHVSFKMKAVACAAIYHRGHFLDEGFKGGYLGPMELFTFIKLWPKNSRDRMLFDFE